MAKLRRDHAWHFVLCLIVTTAASSYYESGVGTGIAMSGGYIRERLGNNDWSDMDANFAGCVVGEIVAAVIR